MRHVTLTCIHHPDLRWNCKEIAVDSEGRYNGSRNIFFHDESGKSECDCPPKDLRFAPEELERQKVEPLGSD